MWPNDSVGPVRRLLALAAFALGADPWGVPQLSEVGWL